MVDKKDFRQELAATAKKICTPGKGILAADESEGTIGKKFKTIDVENNEENRRAYRQLLFSTPDLNKYISGVITFSETCTHSFKGGDHDGKKFVDVLNSLGIMVGIKVDKGVQNLPNTAEETSTKGLDSLAAMCAQHYAIGCRFAKWRSVLKIDQATGCPTETAIHENAWQLARYAAICQENGLVPIVEPEILADGPHSIEHCQKVTEKVLAACFKALNDQNVFLEGCLLKPNMVTPGSQHATRKTVTPQEIATRTVVALQRTVPPALVGVVFLSGGMSEEEASLNLNAMNKLDTRKPWFLSFSYGRALQNTCVKQWAGKDIKAGQDALTVRAKANSDAQLGKFTGSGDSSANESLYVEGYKY